jgi:hypothetical protein
VLLTVTSTGIAQFGCPGLTTARGDIGIVHGSPATAGLSSPAVVMYVTSPICVRFGLLASSFNLHHGDWCVTPTLSALRSGEEGGKSSAGMVGVGVVDVEACTAHLRGVIANHDRTSWLAN